MQVKSQNKTLGLFFSCSKNFMVDVYINRNYLVLSAMLLVYVSEGDVYDDIWVNMRGTFVRNAF